MKSPIYYGNSMRRVFIPGERLLLEAVDFENLQVGDIVTVQRNQSPQYVHRIIQKNAASAVTQGDNNPEPDQELLTPDCYFRRVTAAVGKNGKIRRVSGGSCGLKKFRSNQKKMRRRQALGALLRKSEKFFFWRQTLSEYKCFGSEKCYYWHEKPILRQTPGRQIVYAKWFYRLRFTIKDILPPPESANAASGKNQTSALLMDFLRELVWQDAKKWYTQLSSAEQEEFFAQLNKKHLQAIAYWGLNNVLPAEKQEQWRIIYQSFSIAALKNRAALDKLRAVFEQEKIRFALIKGLDLAFRCYPAPALRKFIDWDILIHPADQLRALEVLKKENWVTPFGYELPDSHHHFQLHCKDGFYLEPHKMCSHFDNVDPLEFWQQCKPLAPAGMEHVLSNELRLLVLTRHAAGNHYRHVPVTKLLLDSAYICQQGVNWQALRNLSDRWNFPYSGNLLAAWPEFFPARLIQEIAPDEEQVKNIRCLLNFQQDLKKIHSTEWLMNQDRGPVLPYIISHIKSMQPSILRRKYNLPEQGAYIRVGIMYVWDMSVKAVLFARFKLFPHQGLEQYRDMVDKIEKDKKSK
ncbi:MAG: hypothetical protein E7052_09500 [Lentisphaerae bacterium]|nr:hypothetical protein [Lentisphaerota bacterium]